MVKKLKTILDVKDAESILGEEGIAKIVDKEWKTAPVPSAEDLAEETHKSPMARTNKNSRANLSQYKKNKSKEVKEKIVRQLKYKKKRPARDLEAFFGDLVEESDLDMLDPHREILRDENEERVFMGMLKKFLTDIPREELSASDFDDLICLCTNRIIEMRMLMVAKTHDKAALDAASAIERLRKNSDKIKSNLAVRRTDRVDTKNKQSFSIVDIASTFDTNRKLELEERAATMKKEREEFLRKKGSLVEKEDD